MSQYVRGMLVGSACAWAGMFLGFAIYVMFFR